MTPNPTQTQNEFRLLVESTKLKSPSWPRLESFDFATIMHRSGWPWLKLDLEVPYREMHREAEALARQGLFVPHRRYDEHAGYRHLGWKSLCLHGLSAQQTENFDVYGHASHQTAPYRYTEIAGDCPETVNFLKKVFPFKRYFRVRYMLLEPGGYIAPHQDQKTPGFFAINIALNHPEECYFGMVDKGVLPFSDGIAILPDLSHVHFVQNSSKVARIHLIIHGEAGTEISEYEKLIIRSAERQHQRNPK